MIGKTLGHYQVTSQLGKGGMGEVYRAKDQRLGRDVAIKVLPEEFAKDADRVARFQREAKLLASLNHPNIAAIHGLEESGGTSFLVLELVEGETLADRLKRGPIPVEESLKLGLQIAEALEAAHEKGVIHRDLKPANIKVTPDGKVKVLDFGLAKAFAEEQEVNLSNSPTLSNAATQQGVILGTAAYMSPEQAKGKTVDRRADVWAFGCVVFEMLTGRSLFSADDVSQTLARVLERKPDFSSLPLNLHPKIIEMLERCLEKEARNRYSSISDARVDIQKALSDPSGVLVQPVTTVEPRTRLRTMLPWLTATAAVAVIIAGLAIWKLRPTLPTEPKRVMRFDYDLPQSQGFTNTGRQVVSVSADGTKIVYGANKQLYLKNSNELIAKPIQGTDEDPGNPFFSPDGQWIAYFADKQLKKIGIGGGAPMKVCNAASSFGATWGLDGTILFGASEGIMSVPSNGGTPKMLVETRKGEQIHGPSVLPGGEWLLITVTNALGFTRWDEAQIVAVSLKTGERRLLVSGGSDARYVPTGHLVYALGDDLLAVAFDPGSLGKTGETVPIIEGTRRVQFPAVGSGSANYGFSESGILVYVDGSAAKLKRALVWVDRNGKEESLKAPPDAYAHPKISPDKTRVALSIGSSGSADIWIWNLVRGGMTKLTLDEAGGTFPLWTPDSKRIVFSSNREEAAGIYWRAANGTGEVELLSKGRVVAMYPASWSDNGKTLIFDHFIGADASQGGVEIAALSMEGDRKLKRLIGGGSYFAAHAQVSPNGQWMAYTSTDPGQFEIYVCQFPDTNKTRLPISTGGGQEPRWSLDGRELFYRSGDAMMVATIEEKPTFNASVPKTLFRGNYYSDVGHNWDLHPDGKKFLMIKESLAEATEATSRDKINIVVNWFEELKQRVPTK